jgi:hypothetical protein
VPALRPSLRAVERGPVCGGVPLATAPISVSSCSATRDRRRSRTVRRSEARTEIIGTKCVQRRRDTPIASTGTEFSVATGPASARLRLGQARDRTTASGTIEIANSGSLAGVMPHATVACMSAPLKVVLVWISVACLTNAAAIQPTAKCKSVQADLIEHRATTSAFQQIVEATGEFAGATGTVSCTASTATITS